MTEESKLQQVVRYHRGVDAWRGSDEGRPLYNATRRKPGRGPNTDLTGMSDEERATHRKALRAESQRKRREAKRQRDAQIKVENAETDAMEQNPLFGMF